MKPNAAPTLTELRTRLVGLVETCPVERCNPADCPLYSLRRMKRSQRHRWFEALREDDLQYLAAYHFVCMNLKLKQHPAA